MIIQYWPQFTIIIISAMVLGLELAKHGQPRTGKYNFWQQLIALVIAYFLYYMGGFFDGLLK